MTRAELVRQNELLRKALSDALGHVHPGPCGETWASVARHPVTGVIGLRVGRLSEIGKGYGLYIEPHHVTWLWNFLGNWAEKPEDLGQGVDLLKRVLPYAQSRAEDLAEKFPDAKETLHARYAVEDAYAFLSPPRPRTSPA